MKRKNTTWSRPKTNILAGIVELSNALSHGLNAVLVKEWNENCEFPIMKKNYHDDFRCYEFQNGHISNEIEILNHPTMSNIEKYLSINYKTCYGTPDAVEQYYQTGKLTMDNVRGMGVSHLVRVTDLVRLLKQNNDDGYQDERIDLLEKQYITREIAKENHFYDFFKLSKGLSHYSAKKFKKKVWVVQTLEDDEKVKTTFISKLALIFSNSFKYIPKKFVFKNENYTEYSFSIGSIENGLKIKIQIPKKFSFN